VLGGGRAAGGTAPLAAACPAPSPPVRVSAWEMGGSGRGAGGSSNPTGALSGDAGGEVG